MGINSTGTAYNFGQLGSGFVNSTGAFTPPAGKVIVAITFLVADQTLAALVADTSAYTAADGSEGDAYFSHTAAVAANGGGSDPTDASTKFPAGMTIYGRWTSLTLSGADADGGVMCYFGY
tara:strand:- start:372 stop:734 length:363 start_codon:yes stop_codon:yes gene_type:complete